MSLDKLRCKIEIKTVILKKTNVVSKAVVQIETNKRKRAHLRVASLEPISLNISIPTPLHVETELIDKPQIK
jgi:hypothetical protein